MRTINFKYGIVTISVAIAIFFAFSTSNLYSQCCSMKSHSSHSGNTMKSSEGSNDTTLIRKGKIDVYDIDFDKDGFVYQDPMHWNVISDKPGTCTICGMELEKVKNKEAILNLKEHDFEVKE